MCLKPCENPKNANHLGTITGEKMSLQLTLQNVGFWRSSPGVFLVNPTLVWVSLQPPWLFFFGDFSWFVPNMSTSPQDLTHFRNISCCWSSCHFRELDSRTWTVCWFLTKSCHVHLNREVVTYCSIASVVDDRWCLLDIMDTVQRLSCKELCESKTFCRCGSLMAVELWRNLENKLLFISINFILKN